MAASRGLPTPAYIQHTGGDAEFLKLALKTGRYVSVTYNGRDNIHYSGAIAHMVNLVHLSDRWAAIHDNNFPGKWLWLPTADFLNRWRGSGGGWAVVLLKPGPPPIPVNRPSLVFGQRLDCSSGSCRIVPSSTEMKWLPDPQHPGYFYLFAGSRQLGTWYPDGRGYLPIRPDGSWGEATAPPLAWPEGAMRNFGLDVQRVSSENRYWMNGRPAGRGEALAAFGSLVDDSNKLRLTIVGDESLRQRVRTDLAQHAELLKWRDRLLVQEYPPDHWAVAGVGMAPGITIQGAPDGAGKAPVLARLPEYRGPDLLIAAIRKADPSYKPESDSPPESKPTSSFDIKNLPAGIWVLAGLTLLLFFARRKEKS